MTYTFRLTQAQAYAAINALQALANEMQEQMVDQEQEWAKQVPPPPAQNKKDAEPNSENKPEAQS
jgi:hypothetical protein